MKLAITIRVMAEDRKELEILGGIYHSTQDHFNELHAQGYFGDPAKTEMRFLVVGGRWFPSEEPIKGVEVPPESVTHIEEPTHTKSEETFP